MVGEALAGLSAFKTMFDMAKALQGIHDTVARDRAVIELQKEILSAQAEQSALVEEVRTLKEQVARLETWNTEKKRYDLKSLGWGAYAYMLKPSERGTEPPTWVCTNCYEHDHKAIIQLVMKRGEGQLWLCPSCKNTIMPETGVVAWID